MVANNLTTKKSKVALQSVFEKAKLLRIRRHGELVRKINSIFKKRSIQVRIKFPSSSFKNCKNKRCRMEWNLQMRLLDSQELKKKRMKKVRTKI